MAQGKRGTKSTTPEAPSKAIAEDRVDLLVALGQLIKKQGAQVSVVDWANLLMNYAEDYVGVSGETLLSRTIEISAAAKQGKVVKHDMHFSIYSNKVRDDLLASKHVQRRAMFIVVNMTKMATAYLLKDPISVDLAQSFIDPVLQEVIPRMANILTSYLLRIVASSETTKVLFDTDFVGQLEDPIRSAYVKYISDNWADLTHGKN